MPPETEQQQSEQPAEQQPAEPTYTKAQLEQIVKDRLERAQRRAEADQAKAAEDARLKALEEQGEWKTLADTRQQRIAELEAQTQAAATAQAQADRYKAALEAMLKTERAALPKPIIALLDKLDPADQLEWIAANRAEVQERPATGGTPQRTPGGRTPAPKGQAETARPIINL